MDDAKLNDVLASFQQRHRSKANNEGEPSASLISDTQKSMSLGLRKIDDAKLNDVLASFQQRHRSKANNEGESSASLISDKQKSMSLSPRSRYAHERQEGGTFTSELMLMLNPHRVAEIKQAFTNESGRSRLLNLHQFVKIIMTTAQDFLLPATPENTLLTPPSGLLTPAEFSQNCCEIFQQIDSDGDNCVEWKEFSAYLVNIASSNQVKHDLQHKYYRPLSQGSSRTPGFKKQPVLLQRRPMTKLLHIPHCNLIAALDQASPVVNLYHSTGMNAYHAQLNLSCVPLALVNVPERESILVSGTNKTLTQVQLSTLPNGRSSSSSSSSMSHENPAKPTHEVVATWKTNQPQFSLCWIPRHDVLYGGSYQGQLVAMTLPSTSSSKNHHSGHHHHHHHRRSSSGSGHHSQDVTLTQRESKKAHTDAISCLLNLDHLNNVVSGSFDRTICIWDIYTGQRLQRLQGHKRGISCLTYQEPHQLLVSAAAEETSANIWSPFIPTLIHTLAGHKHHLVHVERVPNSDHQIMSADTGGVVKIWDIRTYACLQTFKPRQDEYTRGSRSEDKPKDESISKSSSSKRKTKDQAQGLFTSALAYANVEYESRIVLANKNLVSFNDGGEVKLHPVTSEFQIRYLCFNTNSMSLLTVTGTNDVLIWCALTGVLQRTYKLDRGCSSSPSPPGNHLKGCDISAICLDARERRFILGRVQGQIQVYNYRSGVWIKNLHRHEMEIVALKYCHDVRQILSVSKNGAIGVHHDFGLQTGESSLLRIMDPVQQHPNITSVALSRHDDFLTLGSADGLVQVWGVESGKVLQEFTLNPNNAPGISSLLCFDVDVSSSSTSTTILAVGTDEAEIFLYSIQPLRLNVNHAQSPLCHLISRFEQKCTPEVDIRGFSPEDLIKRKTLARVHGYTLESLETLLPDIPLGSSSSGSSGSPHLSEGDPQQPREPRPDPPGVTNLIWRGAGATTGQLVSASEEGLVFSWTLNFSPGLHPEPDANLMPSTHPPIISTCLSTLDFVRQVHSGAIVDLVSLPPMLAGFVTASADNCVSAWSWRGARYGTLVPDRVIPSVASRQPDWDIPADTRAIREAEAREAQELFRAVRLTSLRNAWDIPVVKKDEKDKVEKMGIQTSATSLNPIIGPMLEATLSSGNSSTGPTPLLSPKVRDYQKKIQQEASLKVRPKARARFKSMAWKISHVSKLQLLLEQNDKPKIMSDESQVAFEKEEARSSMNKEGLLEGETTTPSSSLGRKKSNRVIVGPIVNKPSLELSDGDAALEKKAWLQPSARRALKKLQVALLLTSTPDEDHHRRPNTPSRNVVKILSKEDKSEKVVIEQHDQERVIATTSAVETTKIS